MFKNFPTSRVFTWLKKHQSYPESPCATKNRNLARIAAAGITIIWSPSTTRMARISAAFTPIRTRPRDSPNANGAHLWSNPRASAKYPEQVRQLQQMHCFDLVFGVVACYKIRGRAALV